MDRKLAALLSGYIAVGIALCFLYPDGSEQDGPTHFYFCRWAWKYPHFFIAPWPRPLFTVLYAFPAALGYLPAKMLSVFVTAAAAWQTVLAAMEMGLERPWLAAPILLVSPVLFLLSIETMTEPIFALLLAVALRLYYRGSLTAALVAASFFPTIRPEGFLLALLFAIATVRRQPFWKVLWLGTGCAACLAASWIVTRDPMFLVKTWPWNSGKPNPVMNPFTQSLLGLATYPIVSPLIVGPLVLPFTILGIVRFVRERRWLPLALVFGSILLYSSLTALNLFAANASLRYLAPVVPALALMTAAGWRGRPLVPLAISAVFAVALVDLVPPSRDVFAFRDALNGRRPAHLLASKMTPYILLDHEPPPVSLRPSDREGNLELIRSQPPGTLVCQDVGWGWFFRRPPRGYGLTDEDYAAAGYRKVFSRDYDLRPRFPWPKALLDLGLYRRQRIDLYEK